MERDKTGLLFSQYCMSLGLLCVLLYMYGFFPIKTSSNVYSSQEDFPRSLQDIKFHKEKLYNGSVNKTVLMVIDGLRVDFVTEELMPYTSTILAGSKGEGCQLTARVSAPTVTLPRVKAIVTGTVSSFIDVVLNFGTVELTIDSIIQQVSQTNTVVFYGDDTWIKLFPHHFTRSDGTVSFFVNDYTEVDDNVTRHLEEELKRTDWDLMILHYLGLDHIGHIEGPKSALIKPKLNEMDDIIARLHMYLQKQSGGLLLICGDHGMKDSGSHGGVSTPEVLVPAITLGLSCPNHFKEEILQVDLAATLSILWGMPIPADSIGVAAIGLLGHLPPAHRLYTLLYNAQQLANNFLRNGGSPKHEFFLKFEEAKQKHYEWLVNSSTVSYHDVQALYQDSLINMSRFLSEVLANYDMLALVCAKIVLLQVMCVLGLVLLGARTPHWSSVTSSLTIIAVITITVVTSYLISGLFLSVILIFISLFSFNVILLYHQLNSLRMMIKNVTCKIDLSWHTVLPIGTLLFCISLFSSSLIEEEHQLWYFLWVTIGVLKLPKDPIRWFSILTVHRILRTLNQTGDKWAHLPDLSDWLSLPQNRPILSILSIISLACICWCCTNASSQRLFIPLYLSAASCIYLHKAANQQVVSYTPSILSSGVREARLCWLFLFILLLLGRHLGCVISCWMLVSCLLLRPYNTLLVPSLFVVSKAVSRSTSSTLSNTVLHHWIGLVFFFCQGNSNSLASVEVAAGYVGLTEYNFFIVSLLLFMHTYAMPVLAYLLNVHSIINKTKYWRQEVIKSGQVVIFLQLLHILFCLIVITLHRYHLFVWTVFSPKLLYVGAQTFVYFVLVSITNICIYYL